MFAIIYYAILIISGFYIICCTIGLFIIYDMSPPIPGIPAMPGMPGKPGIPPNPGIYPEF